MGVVVAALLAVGLALGLLVDHLAGTAPLFLFVGLALGLAGSIGYAIAKFREALAASKAE